MPNTIEILIKAYGGQAKREISDFDKGLKSLGQTADRVGSRLMLFGGAGAAGLALLGRSALKTAADMEQTRVSFTTLLKSSAEAQRSLRALSKFAAETPFEFHQVTAAAKQLLAYGFNARQLIPTLRSVGDAVSAVGAGPEGMERVIRALGQMQAKGKVSQEELNQLSELGLNAGKILQEQFHLTAKQMEDIGKAGIPAQAAIQAILKGFDKAFGGGMQAQSKTMGGIISNLSDLWSQFLSNADATGLGDRIAQEAKPALEDLLNEITKLKTDGTLDKWAKDVGDSFAQMAKTAGRAMKFVFAHPDLTAGAAKWGTVTLGVSLASGAMLKLGALATKAWPAVRLLGNAMSGLAVSSGLRAGLVQLGMAWRLGGLVGVFGAIKTAIAGVGALLGPGGLLIAGIVGVKLAWDKNLFGMRDAWNSFRDWVMSHPIMARIFSNWTGATHQAPPMQQDTSSAEMQAAHRWAHDNNITYLSNTDQSGRILRLYHQWRQRDTARRASQAADTTNGRSPGAAAYGPGAAGVDERKKWRQDAAEYFANIQDYLRARGVNPSGLRMTNTLKGAHNRYRALDIGGPAGLYPMVIEAAHALGLKVSDESTPGRFSRNATGPHLHLFEPTSGQKAAYETADAGRKEAAQRAKQRSEERARNLERLAEIRRQMTAEANALDQSPYGKLHAANDQAREAASQRIDELRRTGGNARDIYNVYVQLRSQLSANWQAYYGELDKQRQEDLDRDRKVAEEKRRAAEEQLRALQETRDHYLEFRGTVIGNRMDAAQEAGVITDEDLQALKDYQTEWLTLHVTEMDYYQLLQKLAEFERQISDARKMQADLKKKADLDALETEKVRLQNLLLITQGEKERAAILQQIYETERKIADLQGQARPEPPRKEEKPDEYRERLRRVGDLAGEDVGRSFANRLVSILEGKKPKDAWKGFLADLKAIFFDALKELLAAWLKHEIEKLAISKLFAKKRQAVESQGPGGIAGLLGGIGGLFGGGGDGGGGGLGGILGAIGTSVGGPIGGVIGGLLGGLFGLKAPLPALPGGMSFPGGGFAGPGSGREGRAAPAVNVAYTVHNHNIPHMEQIHRDGAERVARAVRRRV